MEAEEIGAQVPYQKPPQAVQTILDISPTPRLSLNPTRDYMLLLETLSYPPVADLAEPMLKLAGLRVSPKRFGPHSLPRVVGLTLRQLGQTKGKPLHLPKDARIGTLLWAPDGTRFAFTNTTNSGIELWICDVATAKVKQMPDVQINAVYGDPVQWLPDSRTIVCQTVQSNRGQPPQAKPVPIGPKVMESSGKLSPVRTYQDLLQNAHDEDLLDYYGTSQLVKVDTDTGKFTRIGQPHLYYGVEVSPDGQHLLVSRLHRPYSYLLPIYRFPREVEVWDMQGQHIHKVASLPLQDEIPIQGVPTGPRWVHWLPTAPATLIWTEALDDVDPNKEVPHRDRLLLQTAPFKEQPTEWIKLQHRFSGISWTDDGWVFVSEYDRDRRWKKTFFVNSADTKTPPRLIWDMSSQERYKHPGSLLYRTLPNGHRVVHQVNGHVFLSGDGSSPKGDFPFLDKMDLKTLKSERVFQCSDECYEYAVALMSKDGKKYLTRHESLTEPPNYFSREAGKDEKIAVTNFDDKAPQLRMIKKQLVTYKREDGVALSFTLYLPPDYKQGQRLPAVVWAYPREYADPSVAGQVSGSPYRFTNIGGTSHLFFLLAGYAVLDGATMPVVGDPETVNATFIKQITDSAKAAIDKADEMGVIDRKRVGIGGHSYGAFMTANLLAHSDLFRAGVARSGAYNRTLTPFGFQNERRTLWEARDTYFKVSPFLHAEKINEPILLLHGEVDNNAGTFPLQSERMYHAIKGNGGTVRLVMLPHESHGYRARESVEHTLHEMIRWFDMYVKGKE